MHLITRRARPCAMQNRGGEAHRRVVKKSAMPDADGASESDFLQNLGSRVRDARARHGMTRRLLAHDSGISERYLAELESGRGNFSIGPAAKAGKRDRYPAHGIGRRRTTAVARIFPARPTPAPPATGRTRRRHQYYRAALRPTPRPLRTDRVNRLARCRKDHARFDAGCASGVAIPGG